MTKAEKLRAALRESNNRMPRADAVKIVGSSGGLSNMLRSGELTSETIKDAAWVVLDPNHKRQRKTAAELPVKRRKKKRAAGHKRHRKSLRDIARRVRKQPGLHDIATDNLIGAGAMLAIAVRNGVDGIDENPQLRAALENHERAQKIHAAA